MNSTKSEQKTPERTAEFEALLKKIDTCEAVVGVLGQGYVGLPLSVCFAEAGYDVLGFDVSEERVKQRSAGRGDGSDVTDEELKVLVHEQKKLSFTTDFSRIAEVDAVVICVPTPLSKHRVPELSYIVSAMGEVSKYLRKNCMIVLESTTYPGCTREIVVHEMERKGFVMGHDCFVAFSPERVDPGNQHYNTKNCPKVMGSVTANCQEVCSKLYSKAIETIVTVDSPEEAEMVKLLENTFRAVNIALVNELCQMASRMKINIWNVIRAAKTKPFGFMAFTPGPGIGGHCIPLDPQYLSFTAKTYAHYNRFIELASDINENMPEFVINRLFRVLNDHSKCLKGSRILILGLAYKKNVEDTRESPSIYLWKHMNREQINVSYHDPHVPEFRLTRDSQTVHKSVELTPESIASFDVVLISTDHDKVDYQMIADNAQSVFDTRNALSKRNIKMDSAKLTIL
eukprot:TRINITY_DN67287_c7_g1_i1.p1 TRINITY_DN67287_c7_g1~~TRINITY_DN67287_c7_g1_i1.p1  ORF type:complete len:457 (+),score=269.06 TRINITY_DN67287_c7_g1_i1:115-1485(+)